MRVLENITQQKLLELLIEIHEKSTKDEHVNTKDVVQEIEQRLRQMVKQNVIN